MPLNMVQSRVANLQPQQLAGSGITGMPILLAYLYGANFNSTADQALTMNVVPQIAAGTPRYKIWGVEVNNASTSLTTAAGGIYTAVSKGGTAIIPAQQVYTSLTAATSTLTLPQTQFTPSLSPAAVGAATTAEQTFTVNGLAATTWGVSVVKPTAQAGLGIAGARVSAANTLAITFVNPTAGSLTPTASETYIVNAFPPALSATITANPLYLSLTTAQGATATADVYVYGWVMP